MTALKVDGATLILTPDGVSIQYGWLPAQEITKEDAIKIRDWLLANFPIKEATTQ